MTSEQARGQAADKRADIWSFGVVLYELLTGQQLYAGPTVSDTLAAVLTRDPEWSRIPPKAARLLRACLERDPKRRLRDVGDARRLLEEAPDAASPPASGNRTLWFAACSVLFLIAAITSWLAFRRTPTSDHPLRRFSVDLGPDAVSVGRQTAVLSPDGNRIVFLARGSAGNLQLATRTLDQPKATPLAGTDDAADPFFSPNSQWIGFFAAGRLKKISVQGGGAVVLCSAGNDRGAAWGEDGSIIFAPNITSGLSRIHESGGTAEVITDPTKTGNVSHRWPQFLPGGQTVLFTASAIAGSYDDATIQTLNLKTGKLKIVQRGGYFGRYAPSGHLLYIHLGTLFAVPFDPVKLETHGTPTPVQDEVAANPISGSGQFDFSRDGMLEYVSGKGQAGMSIWWADANGTAKPLVSNTQPYLTPRFSPDGKSIAVAVNGAGAGDLWLYDLQRDSMRQMTFGARVARSAVWAPDGKHIALTVIGVKGGYDIAWLRADGAGERTVILDGSGSSIYPSSFSPDGKRLAYYDISGAGGSDISILPLDLTDPDHPKPGKPEPFLNSPASELEPAFSPDGRWIAYTSDESGTNEVFVRAYHPGALADGGHWRISPSAGKGATWSRDGKQLYYLAGDDHYMVADVAPSNVSFEFTKPRRWSDRPFVDPIQGPTRQFDFTPDSKHVITVEFTTSGGGQPGSVHLTFLLNFFDDLRRRVPN